VQSTPVRKVFVHTGLVLLLSTMVVAGAPESFRYRFGATYGLGNLIAPKKPYYTFNHLWGFSAGMDFARLNLTFGVLSQKNYSDSGASGHSGFFADRHKATRAFTSIRTGFDADYHILNTGRFRPTIGLGLGYLIWRFADPAGDTVVRTLGSRDNIVDFGAAEMYLSAALGLEVAASRRLALHLKTSVDCLTGVGTAFADSVEDHRGRMLFRAGLTFSYRFGAAGGERLSEEKWPSEKSWAQAIESPKKSGKAQDADMDGVADKRDRCPHTPPGAIVDKMGCPTDSDGDGVLDGVDNCAQTPLAAAGYVDIYGCPVDADYDGVPDYRDRCLSGPLGAAVDDDGCPVDADGDGVYDGLDDCPGTEAGIEVDERGCIDIAFLRDTMRIYIDYDSGSFEVDVRTRERLGPLIRKLKILAQVKIEIVGYTDNVGAAEANQSLSQKRANRMRDWLAGEGIAAERMTAIGKGETNFIASNDTAEGRAKNRRIEFIFSQY